MIHMILQRGKWRKQVLKIFGPKLIRINLLIKTVRSAVSKNRVERSFFSDFENTKLVARRRTHFQVFPAIFLVAQLCPKRGVLVHKISLASCSGPLLRQRFLRRCEETACNRKKIEISLVFVAIMFMCWHTLFQIIFFVIDMVLCDLYLKRFDLTEGLFFKTFVITVWYKLCRYDYLILELESFSSPMN